MTKRETALGWYWSERQQEWQLARIAGADRAIHTYVIGASGSGKTKFLEALIRQDIEHGQGCGVIDPHGDLIEDLKGYLTLLGASRGDAWLRERVVLIDLADPHQTVAFNPLEALPGVSAGEQAAELISAFRKIWADSWGVRMEDLLRNALIALSEAGLSLVELPRFLTDAPTRAAVLAQLEHPIARDYFTRYNALSTRNQLTWAEPVLNKINALLANDHVRHLLGSRTSTFNLREVLDSGKLLLVKLDKGRLKDAADLLGSLLLSKLQLAIFSRSDTPAWARTPFYLYVDEFQNFAGENFAVFLSEARKYGLSLVLAHQTLAQIPVELQSLILGNTGLQVVFRVNRRDAERMAKEFFSYSGYEVKQATLSSVKTWSLGEEWERYTAELQQQPPRAAYIKHKLQGGLIPIETADVVAAWELVEIDPRTFLGLVARAPIGAAYLRPRRTGTSQHLPPHTVTPPPGHAAHAAPPVPSTSASAPHTHAHQPGDVVGSPKPQQETQPASAALSAEAQAFLQLVLDEPSQTVSELYTSFGASVWKGAKLRERLVAEGYLVEVETRLGRGGRPSKFLIPTPTALELLPTTLPPGRGGPLHCHLQRLVGAEGMAKGYQVTPEFTLAEGGIVDVHLARGPETVAVEISITSDATRELEHLSACLTADYDRIIAVVWSAAIRTRLAQDLPKSFDPAACARIRVVPVTAIGRLL